MFNVYIPVSKWNSDIDTSDPVNTFKKLTNIHLWCEKNLEDDVDFRGIAHQYPCGRFGKLYRKGIRKRTVLEGDSYIWFAFKKKSDAALFKLTWG